MLLNTHGGDLRRMAALAGRAQDALLDFSVNVRPEGPADFLQYAMLQAMNNVAAYPSPHAEEALDAAAKHHGLSAECFAFGNGSNEVIHALAQVLKKCATPMVCLVEPAFSEYALACRLAGLTTTHVWDELTEAERTPLLPKLAHLPAGSAVFLANPGNPGGMFRSPEVCLALVQQRPDLIWIFDEAFVEYVGADASVSLIPCLPQNGVVLRSLTKFYAIPGVRLGYLAAESTFASMVRQEIPAWSVNCFALSAALAVFADCSNFAEQTRSQNSERRAQLVAVLSTVCGIELFPSVTNYVLFRCVNAPKDLALRLLKEHGIAIRDCANYHRLEDGSWFRVAVRYPEDHQRLADALQQVLTKKPRRAARQRHTPALMLLGTSSNAGKSILAAAYCRIFRQDGYNVAPFKAQNMSLNSGVTLTGEEMGRAQILQAQAARVDPDARMNPILLKPHSDTGSQVILRGQALGHMPVQEYFAQKKDLWASVTTAYDELAANHDIMVLEGAGSPAEINLKTHDLVNMRMALHAKATALLVGDIDRGGVYASFLGTWLTFNAQERRLLAGYLVNRFRGDASLLAPAHADMLRFTNTPVLGTIPYIRDLNLPEEDSLCAPIVPREADPTHLDIAVIMLGHVSNHTDVAPLAMEPDVRLRHVRRPEEWGQPHVVLLPGSKSVAHDLEQLRANGLAESIQAHAAQGGWIFGICGGLQMLGQAIFDPHGVESAAPSFPGLGLLDIRSTFAPDKTLVHVAQAETPLGVASGGYEIHHGQTEHGASARPLFLRADRQYATENERICGYVTGKCWATYLHGIFDNDAFRRAWLDHVRADVGLVPQGRQRVSYDLEHALDRLADVVREHTDMRKIYALLGF